MTHPIVIGFDLGHAESALASASPESNAAPMVLDLPGSLWRRHTTAVARTDDGIHVGRTALAAGGRLYTEFKSSRVAEEETATPVRLFVGQVIADLIEGAQLDPSRPVRWVFGAPSAWPEELRTRYADLLRDCIPAEIVVDRVEVVAESRAAMLHARDSAEVPHDAFLRGAALIIDLGSSTTDYTFVESLVKYTEFGNDRLGAWLIEDAIATYVLGSHPQRAEIMDVVKRDPDELRRLRFAFREAKEEFFRTSGNVFRANPSDGIRRRHRVRGPGGEMIIEFELFPTDMDMILGTPIAALRGKTWQQAFRDDLVDVIAQCKKAPDYILLTGGASRMRFVVDTTREVVGSDATVAVGSEPEFAIARGLAIAGRIGVRTQAFHDELDELIASKRIEALVSERLPELAQAMANAAVHGMTERHVIPAFRSWRDGGIQTLNGMTEHISAQVNRELSAAGGTVHQAVAIWQNGLRTRIDELTRPICSRADIDPVQMAFPAVTVSSGDIPVHVPTGAATSMLEMATAAISVAAAGVISTVLFGSGIALILTTGPFGVAVAFVVALVVLLIGRQAALDQAMGVNLPAWLRRLNREEALVSKLRSTAAASEAELATKVKDQILATAGPNLTAQISQGVTAELKRLAAEAELQIL